MQKNFQQKIFHQKLYGIYLLCYFFNSQRQSVENSENTITGASNYPKRFQFPYPYLRFSVIQSTFGFLKRMINSGSELQFSVQIHGGPIIPYTANSLDSIQHVKKCLLARLNLNNVKNPRLKYNGKFLNYTGWCEIAVNFLI